MNSLTEENYVKAVYLLSLSHAGKISPTVVADDLQVNAASVVDMIKKLTVKKLITYHKTTGMKLTAKGLKTALGIVRNHRLWEVFLLEKLGYSWDVVHEIAEQLEHVKHPELADRLDTFLGNPQYDPHGDPIPMRSGKIPLTVRTTLSDVPTGKSCKVVAVKDTSPIFLQYLQQLGVNIHTSIKVIDRIEFDDTLVVKIGNQPHKSVSKKFADSLLVD
ncbi:MAG: metal-dependent transcriptional regulator [Ignavibacteria bacterium]|nr:metal-dependent transcriptional regulator [Ignavibacteria bacterium]